VFTTPKYTVKYSGMRKRSGDVPSSGLSSPSRRASATTCQRNDDGSGEHRHENPHRRRVAQASIGERAAARQQQADDEAGDNRRQSQRRIGPDPHRAQAAGTRHGVTGTGEQTEAGRR
jgi:hypothetical protein